MGASKQQATCTAVATAQIGHNGGPDMALEELLKTIGPKRKLKPSVFQCGAPWTAHATDAELISLGILQGQIERTESRLKELRAKRTTFMMRCIRRMRRALGMN